MKNKHIKQSLARYHVINVSIGSDDCVYILAINNIPDSFCEFTTDTPYDYRVLIIDTNHEVKTIDIKNQFYIYHYVQLIEEDNVLLVGSRCEYYQDGSYDFNGKIFNPDGRLVRELLLGDGIEHVYVTERNNIWIGYFDEGVYGNFGWGRPGGTSPIGESGLVKWDQEGRKNYEFDQHNEYMIDDCYGLNVMDDQNIYFYSGYEKSIVNFNHELMKYHYIESDFLQHNCLVIYENYFLLLEDPKGTFGLYQKINNMLVKVKQFNLGTFEHLAYRGSRLILYKDYTISSIELTNLIKD